MKYEPKQRVERPLCGHGQAVRRQPYVPREELGIRRHRGDLDDVGMLGAGQLHGEADAPARFPLHLPYAKVALRGGQLCDCGK